MINPADFNPRASITAQASSPTSVSPRNDPKYHYTQNWWQTYERYNDCHTEPITTQFMVLECHSDVSFFQKSNTDQEILTVDLALMPVEGLVANNTYIEVRLWGKAIRHNSSTLVKAPSAQLQSFVNLLLAENPQAFTDTYLENTKWDTQRVHYPVTWGMCGIVSFAPDNYYRDKYGYSAFFFSPNKEPNQSPMTSFELNQGKLSTPPDFQVLNQILKDRYESFAQRPTTNAGYASNSNSDADLPF